MTAFAVVDQYPSTDDTTILPDEDGILTCLINARERVATGHAIDSYIETVEDSDKILNVCAIGAVWATDGLTEDDVEQLEIADLEARLSEDAQTAISLLNEAARSLHPECDGSGWFE